MLSRTVALSGPRSFYGACLGNWHINFSFEAKYTPCGKVLKISVNGRRRKSVKYEKESNMRSLYSLPLSLKL